jgi:hypothetical protein
MPKKCLHSLDDIDIKQGRSTIKKIYSGYVISEGTDKKISSCYYCPLCGSHWWNSKYNIIKYTASELAVKIEENRDRNK